MKTLSNLKTVPKDIQKNLGKPIVELCYPVLRRHPVQVEGGMTIPPLLFLSYHLPRVQVQTVGTWGRETKTPRDPQPPTIFWQPWEMLGSRGKC